jgi:hypothetical protein
MIRFSDFEQSVDGTGLPFVAEELAAPRPRQRRTAADARILVPAIL